MGLDGVGNGAGWGLRLALHLFNHKEGISADFAQDPKVPTPRSSTRGTPEGNGGGMSTTVLLALQSGLIFLQLVNAGLPALGAHVPGWLTLVLAGAVGSGQFFVQHVGNQTVPPPPPTKS